MYWKISNDYIVFPFLHSEKDYYIRGKWINKDKCKDGKKLFKAIIPKIDSFVKNVKVKFFDHDNDTEIKKREFHKYFLPSDTYTHMRCYTSDFSKNEIEKGIEKITLRMNTAMRIYFHSLGMFYGTKKQSHRFVKVAPRKKYRYVVDYEVYETLNTSLRPCIENITYDKDALIKYQLYKVFN